MIDPLKVLPGERGILRLFALDQPPQQVQGMNQPLAARLLGVDDLDVEQIDIVDLNDLSGVGLAQYLVDGFAIPPDQVERSTIDALTGLVLILRSHAFRGRAATLSLSPHLTLIATYSETQTNWTAAPIQPAEAIQRRSSPPGRSPVWRIGAVFFAGVMALVLLIVILVLT